MNEVTITLPTGESATVPQQDLGQALAAGAHLQTEEESTQREIGGTTGQLATGALAAGRVATMGLSDMLVAEGANIANGPQARKDVLKALSLAREANPYADMAGEGAGLLLGGGGMTALGERTEAAVTGELGSGLLGSAASMGARTAAESAVMGAQHQISEDYLGDHELNGQAIFANAAKDGLIGLGVGTALGGAGYKLGGLLRRTPGVPSNEALDELAGVEGAGQKVYGEARRTEGAIEDMRKAGATTDQAAQMADEVDTIARARATSGPMSGLLDDVGDAYITRRAAGNTELRDALAKGYADRASMLSKQEEILDQHARAMADKGTRAMRELEDTVNEVHFTERPQQMAKLVDPANYSAMRDAANAMGQDVKGSLDFFDSLATKGGGEAGVKRLQKTLKDFSSKMSSLPEEGGTKASADAFMNAYKVKQAVGKYAGFGKPEFLKTDFERGMSELYEKLRVGLEDEGTWGGAGAATREWNESFSMAKGRRDDFGRRFAVNVDQVSGVIKPEIDAGKVKGLLNQLGGAEADQGIKTTEQFIDGLRARAAKIKQFGELSPQQAAKLDSGLKALTEFESTFQTARKESEVVARIKQQQADEEGKGVGGLLGLITDTYSKPLTTMQRLAEVRSTVKRIEEGVQGGLKKFFGSKEGQQVVERVAPRAKEDAVKEMGKIRELAGNPVAMESKLSRMTSGLADVAPKIAEEVKNTARRAMYFLAKEAPTGVVRVGLASMKDQKPRFSDQEIHAWEEKRRAALGAVDGTPPSKAIIEDMHTGRLNREAIRTIEYVSPKLFQQIQQMAQDEIMRMDQKGLLDRMPYQQKAAIASLLKIPADGTWTPDFMAMMAGAQAATPPQTPSGAATAGPAPQRAGGQSAPAVARALKTSNGMFSTETQRIEAGGQA